MYQFVVDKLVMQMMIKLEEIKEMFKSFRELCRKEREWGGYIFPTGEIKIFEGNETWIDREISGEEKKNLICFFHTHPFRFEQKPSINDIFSACRSGITEYIITLQGIYEIIVEEVLSRDKIREMIKTITDEVWDKKDYKNIVKWHHRLKKRVKKKNLDFRIEEKIFFEFLLSKNGLNKRLKEVLPVKINFYSW